MPLPNPLSVQMIAGLRDNPLAYESHKKTIEGQNQIIFALQPGAAIAPQNFALSPSLGSTSQITALSGSLKRGRFTVTIAGSGLAPNPTVTLNFPKGTFSDTPFAQIVRNGGTGTLGFSYIESVKGIVITLAGTATAGHTYTFQFAVRD